MVVIEMNPRVSRSSALASKATGFPIAKIAARLAVGYRSTRSPTTSPARRPASFEPTIDYVVTKVPRWAFEKLPGHARPSSGTQMQSVGEVMAIGRTFTESLQKALRSLETGRLGLNCDPAEAEYDADRRPTSSCADAATPTPERLFHARGRAAARRRASSGCTRPPRSTRGSSTRSLQIVEARAELAGRTAGRADPSRLAPRQATRLRRRASSRTSGAPTRDAVRDARLAAGVAVTYKTVDTCAAEFAADTPYHYGTYEDEDEVAPADRARRS